jgi:hypothetical protein
MNRSDSILKAMARAMWRDYGAAAYQAFVLRNPTGRVPGIERRIVAVFRRNAVAGMPPQKGAL